LIHKLISNKWWITDYNVKCLLRLFSPVEKAIVMYSAGYFGMLKLALALAGFFTDQFDCGKVNLTFFSTTKNP